MEHQLAPAELLRFLQAEAEALQHLQAKISNELHHLQVEEEIFVRTLDRLNQNSASSQSNSTNGRAQEESRRPTTTRHQAGVELLEVLHQELVSDVPPVSMLPPNCALPTTLHAITATEADSTSKMKVESQSGTPSGLGFHNDENGKYELLDTLESEGERSYNMALGNTFRHTPTPGSEPVKK